jgi:predicted hotdog family 3-hydroxylacyl-ACP dehydratase
MPRSFLEEGDMSYPDIRTLIPHADPMVLLDRVVSFENENLCAEVTIRPDSLFCGENGVGAWVGIEYMAQAIAAHAGYEQQLHGLPIKIGFLLGSRRYDVNCSSFPIGSVLKVYVHRVLLSENGLGSYECRIEANDEGNDVRASATVTVFQPANIDGFIEGNLNE